jgi:hypothetical protein
MLLVAICFPITVRQLVIHPSHDTTDVINVPCWWEMVLKSTNCCESPLRQDDKVQEGVTPNFSNSNYIQFWVLHDGRIEQPSIRILSFHQRAICPCQEQSVAYVLGHRRPM